MKKDKMLSYRRESALQGQWRREARDSRAGDCSRAPAGKGCASADNVHGPKLIQLTQRINEELQ